MNLLDCQEMAIGKCGYCRSPFYKNKQYPMLWECKYGHQWEASAHKVKNGEWCKQCKTNLTNIIIVAYLIYNNY